MVGYGVRMDDQGYGLVGNGWTQLEGMVKEIAWLIMVEHGA